MMQFLKIKNPIDALQQAWAVMSRLPGGKRTFSKLIGLIVPYTGSIRPEVISIESGIVTVRMRDRRRVRNHLNSIHAIALANLGEVSCGLALNIQLPKGQAAILRRIETEFVKKGRGTLTCECHLGLIEFGDKNSVHNVAVQSTVTDELGNVIARTRTEWKVSAVKEKR
jgi:acyl-coenzyme A thioesterase PaaI-like protein